VQEPETSATMFNRPCSDWTTIDRYWIAELIHKIFAESAGMKTNVPQCPLVPTQTWTVHASTMLISKWMCNGVSRNVAMNGDAQELKF
jgi:hypothetical protein